MAQYKRRVIQFSWLREKHFWKFSVKDIWHKVMKLLILFEKSLLFFKANIIEIQYSDRNRAWQLPRKLESMGGSYG